MKMGSLFSGIAGLERGLERATGAEVVWQAESNPFCRLVLAHHYPKAKRYEDVCDVDGSAERVDIICGGFPCQDLSYAGKGEGLDGARSGLWSEYERIVCVLRPRYVVVENVAALLARGLGRVLGDLAALGYDAWWDCIPAASVGAPHRRDRLFLVAWRVSDADGVRVRLGAERRRGAARSPDAGHAESLPVGTSAELANAVGGGLKTRSRETSPTRRTRRGIGVAGALVGDAASVRVEAELATSSARRDGGAGSDDSSAPMAYADSERQQGLGLENRQSRHSGSRGNELDGSDLPLWPPSPDDLHAWSSVQADAQPAFCSLADGLPRVLLGSRRGGYRRQALEALGNAVVPECGFVAGSLINYLEQRRLAAGA